MEIEERFAQSAMLAEHYSNFIAFAVDGMDFLGFPLTEVQEDIALFMQNGPRLRMVQAQRGEAKSTLAALYAVWRIIQRNSTIVLIISGGEKISPTAVAELLRAHFPNTELYLIGVPDEEWGQALRCVMITSHESKRMDLGEIREIVGAAFGKVAAPRSLLLLSATPIKSNGKIDLHQLKTLPPTQSL